MKEFRFLFDCLFPPATPGELTTAGRSGQHPQRLLHSGVPSPYVETCQVSELEATNKTRQDKTRQEKTRIGEIAAAVAVGVVVVLA